MKTRSPLRDRNAAALWAAALATLVFANSLDNRFAYDDVGVLSNNLDIQSLETLPGLLLEPYWPGEYGEDLGLWRPATTLVLGLQWAASGGAPVLFHLVNVLAHAAATALVVLLLARLATVPIAFVAGLIFAVHPVHVEAVANVVGLAEVLAAVAFLAACLLHVAAPRERYTTARTLAVAACYLAAFLTKESAVTLPGALFLLDAARWRLAPGDLARYARRRGPLYAALAVAACGVLVARYAVLGSIANPMGPLGAGLLQAGVPRIWTLAQVWSHYLRLMVFPLDLSSDYAPNVLPIALGWTPLALTGALVALAVLALALWAWRGRAMEEGLATRRILGFGVVWFIVTISPVSNVLFLSGVLLAERTLYLPSVGFVAIAGWALVRLWRSRRRTAIAVALVTVCLMMVRTWHRTPTWRDNDAVFGTLIADYPQSGRSQWLLGNLFFQAGQVSDALRSYRVAIGILGGHYQLLTEIGTTLMSAGLHETAATILKDAWRIRPDLGAAPTILAVSYSQNGQWSEAEGVARAAFAMDADPVTAHIVAQSLARRGEVEEAVRWRGRVIALEEGEHWRQWSWLASLHLALGDSASAAAALDSALARTASASERTRARALFLPYSKAGGEVLQDSTESQDARAGGGAGSVLP